MASAWFSNIVEEARRVVSGESAPDPEAGVMDEWGRMLKLSYKQRLYGFGISLALCLVLMALSTIFVQFIGISPIPFVFLYTLGLLSGVGSTFFLIGPVRQAKEIVKTNHLVSTIVFFGAVIMTLLVALWLESPFLSIVFIVVQFCALAWYGLSYIPGARTLASVVFRSSVAL